MWNYGRVILLMAELLHPVEVGSLSHDLQGFIHPVFFAGFPNHHQYLCKHQLLIITSTRSCQIFQIGPPDGTHGSDHHHRQSRWHHQKGTKQRCRPGLFPARFSEPKKPWWILGFSPGGLQKPTNSWEICLKKTKKHTKKTPRFT